MVPSADAEFSTLGDNAAINGVHICNGGHVHVVMLTNSVAPDKLGGLERYVRELSAELVRKGAEVTILAKGVSAHSPAIETGDDGVEVSRYSVPNKKDPLFAAKYPFAVAQAASKAVADRPNSILHAHFAVPALPLAMRNLPFMYTFHAPVYKELLSERQDSYVLPHFVQSFAVAGLRQAERMILRRSVDVVTLSHFVQREVAELDETVSSRVVQIPGGIDTEKFRPAGSGDEHDAGLSRDDLTWSAGASPLLMVARRLVPRTGVLQLVKAMPEVLKRYPGARLVVTGDGLSRPAIEAEIDTLRLRDVVRLVGTVDDRALVSWYRRADLVVTPTQELEGFGLATAEAMACGTPALVTPIGANAEVAEMLSTSLVAGGRSPHDIATAINTVLADRDALRCLAELAREKVMHLSWHNVAERYLRIYDGQRQWAGSTRSARRRTFGGLPGRWST